ncbi:hypothetical protein [Hymenobacter rubidus]|uniref:hypothetical protein n=1 Tax=Hymenobacter rubidus TaxID=1441626 RepID=UPI00191DC91D|nr:hypothetical protein [Hymenobacter rubidus]
MSSHQKDLAGQLAAAVAPHLGHNASADRQPPKAVAKTLRQLAKQLTKQQSKQAKAVANPTPLTAKRARKALAGELATVLQPYLGGTKGDDAKTSKKVVKAVKRLAAQVVKQRRKDAKQSAKQAKQAAKQPGRAAADEQVTGTSATAPAAKAPRSSVARAAAPTARRTGTPTKRQGPKAVPATPPPVEAAE